MAEPHFLSTFLGRSDLPGDRGAFPPGKSAGVRPAHELARLQLGDFELERRPAKAEFGNRADLRLSLAVPSPEAAESFSSRDRFVDLVRFALDRHGVHQWSSHIRIPPKDLT